MKKNSIILLLLAILGFCSSCSSNTKCEKIEKRQLFILMDLSDKKLFEKIESDISQNFPIFMQQTKLGDIQPCQQFTLCMAHFGGEDMLNVSSKSIAIQRKGLSYEEEKELANPIPLRDFMVQKIAEYKQLTNDSLITSKTNIASVLVKSINQSEPESQNVFLLFTDGVENNDYVNLYKVIPEERDISDVVRKIVEPSVLEKFSTLKQEGLQCKIIMVLKPDPQKRVNSRAIQTFWINVFNELGLECQFIDNLSNKVDL